MLVQSFGSKISEIKANIIAQNENSAKKSKSHFVPHAVKKPPKKSKYQVVVSIGNNKITAEEYIRKLDEEILYDFFRSPSHKATYNYARAQVAECRFKSTVNRYFDDIDNAVIKNVPKKRLDGLIKRLDRFLTRKKPLI